MVVALACRFALGKRLCLFHFEWLLSLRFFASCRCPHRTARPVCDLPRVLLVACCFATIHSRPFVPMPQLQSRLEGSLAELEAVKVALFQVRYTPTIFVLVRNSDGSDGPGLKALVRW